MSSTHLLVRGAAAAAAALTVGGSAWFVMGPGAVREAPRAGTFAATAAPSASTPVVASAPASPAGEQVGRRDAGLTALDRPDAGGPPVRLRVPAADIDLPIQPMGVDPSGAMEVPSGSSTAAWYRYGPGVGAEEGAAVVAAHVSSRIDGRGPFSRLVALQPGARVDVSTETGAVAYEVVSVEQIAKLSLDEASLFARSGDHRLHLVTCGGRYDRANNSYEDNVVVVARPIG